MHDFMIQKAAFVSYNDRNFGGSDILNPLFSQLFGCGGVNISYKIPPLNADYLPGFFAAFAFGLVLNVF